MGWLIVGAGVAAWLLPFVKTGWNLATPAKIDRGARTGLALQCVGMALMVMGPSTGVRRWRLKAAAGLFAMATLMAWWATRTLGRRHLRLDAAIVEGHELVRRGPYRLLRHPIYTSFLLAVWAIGIARTARWWMFLLATAVFLLGTEIRVASEERLLTEAFGEQFESYRRSAWAYLPPVR